MRRGSAAGGRALSSVASGDELGICVLGRLSHCERREQRITESILPGTCASGTRGAGALRITAGCAPSQAERGRQFAPPCRPLRREMRAIRAHQPMRRIAGRATRTAGGRGAPSARICGFSVTMGQSNRFGKSSTAACCACKTGAREAPLYWVEPHRPAAMGRWMHP